MGCKYMTEDLCQEKYNKDPPFQESFDGAHANRQCEDRDLVPGQVSDGRKNYMYAERSYGAWDVSETLKNLV